MEPGLSSSLFRKRSPDSLRPDQTSIFSILSRPWPWRRQRRTKRPRATTERGLNGGCRAQPCGAGVTPGRGDGNAVLSRWQGPRPPTAGGLNTGCRGHPCTHGGFHIQLRSPFCSLLRARLFCLLLVIQNALAVRTEMYLQMLLDLVV